MADAVAAELTAIRAREQARDVPRLADAVEEVLKLAGAWDAASGKITALLAEAGMPEAVEAAGTPAAGNRRAAELREAITRALLGEEKPNG
jgi:hypothetical protein